MIILSKGMSSQKKLQLHAQDLECNRIASGLNAERKALRPGELWILWEDLDLIGLGVGVGGVRLVRGSLRYMPQKKKEKKKELEGRDKMVIWHEQNRELDYMDKVAN